MISRSISKINPLFADGFRIELTTDEKKKNATLYLLNKSKAEEVAPSLFEDISIVFSGLSEAKFDAGNRVYNARIFIDTDEPIDIQEGIILEEITQSIGLMYDSKKYPNSIFYENKTDERISTEEYSKLDKDIIRLLYHPRMRPGLSAYHCERVRKKIYKEENENK